jgi:hypothetical protein
MGVDVYDFSPTMLDLKGRTIIVLLLTKKLDYHS